MYVQTSIILQTFSLLLFWATKADFQLYVINDGQVRLKAVTCNEGWVSEVHCKRILWFGFVHLIFENRLYSFILLLELMYIQFSLHIERIYNFFILIVSYSSKMNYKFHILRPNILYNPPSWTAYIWKSPISSANFVLNVLGITRMLTAYVARFTLCSASIEVQ